MHSVVRSPGEDDADAMGSDSVRAWRAAYSGGLMPDEYLDSLSAQVRADMYRRRLAHPAADRHSEEVGITGLCRRRHNRDLRHTHAAWLIAKGEHPKTIQTRLGHSSIQVAMDRYGHFMDGLDEQTAVRLDAIIATARDRTVASEAPGISM
ncbi:MAG: tyrosine-type recombinase/integrase [Actinomycetota bacterium]|nr:tyrosine-type recombinase/integrase [Actinomycetota bacterium]